MSAEAAVLDLVGDIYDCAIEPRKWPGALERIVHHVVGTHASISVHDPINRQARFQASWGVDPKIMEQYADKYAAINPALTSGWFCDVDEPVTILQYVGQDEYDRSRFYREFIDPLGWYDGIGLHLVKTANRYGMLAIARSKQQGVFTDVELAKVRVLAPHIRRAVTISDLLDAKALHDDMLSATLDLLTVGIVLVDANALIVHANRAGLRLLDERVALRRADNHLSARDPKAAQDLQHAIEVAASGTTTEFPRSGIAVPITSSQGGDLAAWVLPLDRGLRNKLAAPFAASVAVFCRQLGDTSPFPGELFVKRYGISPAECRVLMMLTQGMSPREAAETLGISEPTAKTHLQRLFQKTGTDRQADLVRLAMSALAPARM